MILVFVYISIASLLHVSVLDENIYTQWCAKREQKCSDIESLMQDVHWLGADLQEINCYLYLLTDLSLIKSAGRLILYLLIDSNN